MNMNGDELDYFYSIRSSFTYLGAERLNAISRKHKVKINHYPMDLAKVVDTYNDVHDPRPAERDFAGARVFEKFAARERYTQIEYQRWSDYLGVPIQLDPKHHYGPRALPSGVVIAAQEQGANVDVLSRNLLAALWRDDHDVADRGIVRDIIVQSEVGIDPDVLCDAALEPETQDILSRNTKLAVERGVFGSPFYIYRDEPFFGQDRLSFLDAAIVGFKNAG